jgi:hypothetical protein
VQTIVNQEDSASLSAPADGLTVGAIGILAYMLASVLHEGAGHGGACLLSGAKPLAVSSVFFECSVDSRLVLAGGTLMNLLAAVAFFALGRLTGPNHPRLKYFWWISMTVNLLTGTGYFLFSGIGGIGDWGEFIKGLGSPWLWRIGLTIFGLLELRPLIGSDREGRYQRAVRLSMIAYFAGGILMCIAGALNPEGMILILISAAASTFGGTSALVWSTAWLKRGTFIPFGAPAAPMPIPRNWLLILGAGVIAIAFIAILGPSVRFAR